MLLGMLNLSFSSLRQRFRRCAFGLMHSPAIPKGQRDCTEAMDSGNLCETCHFLCYRASVPEERNMEGGRSREDFPIFCNYILLFLPFR